jgi:hypothetical protein
MNTYFELATDMSKTDVRELENRLRVLIEHLLKLRHITGPVATDNSRGWNQTVRYQRRDLALHIEEKAGLKSKLNEPMLDKAYRAALTNVKEQYPATPFPPTRELSLKEVVGPEITAVLK